MSSRDQEPLSEDSVLEWASVGRYGKRRQRERDLKEGFSFLREMSEIFYRKCVFVY